MAIGCARRLRDLNGGPASDQALQAVEAFAEGEITVEALRRGVGATTTPSPSPSVSGMIVGFAISESPKLDWNFLAWVLAGRLGGGHFRRARDAQVAVLRDIFGNPFRPVAFDSAWRTSTATALAQQMYESRDFGAMPILADALQDAGCDHEDILTHCRDPQQVHVRGCWVVDLVLEKS